MRTKILAICVLLFLTFLAENSYASTNFISNRRELKALLNKPDIVIIASTGRSGSTMLTYQISKYISKTQVYKTHLLPPNANFKGKIVFIFSSPDQASESALHMIYAKKNFGKRHFSHLETANRKWYNKIGGTLNQTPEENLLSTDALGIYKHLKEWLFERTIPSDCENAQILAIKFENLWDESTVEEIRKFLDIHNFTLPPKRARGAKRNELFSKEALFRKVFNLGTRKNPRYAAYDNARVLWEQAPSYQYFKIKE